MNFIVAEELAALGAWLEESGHGVERRDLGGEDHGDTIADALAGDRIIVAASEPVAKAVSEAESKPCLVAVALPLDEETAIREQVEEIFGMDPSPLVPNTVVIVAPGFNRIVKF
jgi:hypothetical protein